jgi:biopolymer transport protein ExbB
MKRLLSRCGISLSLMLLVVGTAYGQEVAVSGSGRGYLMGVVYVIRQCGLVSVPLIACSFLLFAFVFERLISLRRARVIPRPFVQRFIAQLRDNEIDQRGALSLCRENGSPIADVFAAAVKKWDRAGVEVEQAAIDAGERVSYSLNRYLRLFSGIATITPLLGLLGTVTGMIRSFNVIANADGMGRPDLLADGISHALLTTAAGLGVAIPAYVVHLYFSARVDKLIIEIDSLSQEVVNAVAADGWREKPQRKPKAA